MTGTFPIPSPHVNDSYSRIRISNAGDTKNTCNNCAYYGVDFSFKTLFKLIEVIPYLLP